MLLLGIDTSTRRVGVALGSEDGLLGAVELGGGAGTSQPRHAEQLAPAIGWLCAETGATLGHLSAVAVSSGPGMFTGLRVGVTTAKVLAQTLRIPIVPIPSLDLLAYPLRHASAAVVPVLDARRREVYYARYRPVPGGLQRESGYELGSPDDLVADLVSRGEETLLAGDAALRLRPVFTGLERVEIAGPGFAAPSLAALVELGAARYVREEFLTASEVVPLYLRRSDAEIAAERSA